MRALTASLVLLMAAGYTLAASQRANGPEIPAGPALAPTEHSALPRDLSDYWFVPDDLARRGSTARRDSVLSGFGRGVAAIREGKYAAGVPLVSVASLNESTLSDYAKYYRALALQGLARLDEADVLLTQLADSQPVGALAEAVPLKRAELAVARHDAARAEALLRALAASKIGARDDVLSTLGPVEEELGHREHAVEAYRTIYVSFPTSLHTVDAKAALDRLSAALTPDEERARGERLFAAKRWSDARAAFQSVLGVSTGSDREQVAIRIAESDEHLGRHRAARDELAALLSSAPQDAEVRYAYLNAVKGMGDKAAYEQLVHALVADAPQSTWAIEALNDLASYFVVGDEDEKADAAFRELLQRYPGHRYAERAAWKVGWSAYRHDRLDEAVSIFEAAAARFPRSDYRPAWLYWSARGRDRLEDRVGASARYGLVVSDYGESYYGRLAARHLPVAGVATVALPRESAAAPRRSSGVPTESVMRALMSAGLFDDALREVQYAQRTWGDSSRLQATAAWIRFQQAQSRNGEERFLALRGAITTMRRAYPQFLSAAGSSLPPEVLRVIYPLDYWELITKYSATNGLDPYLIAALMAQESTFTADIRSTANARGLLQVMPATGRRYARKLGLRSFSTASLAQAETNVKIGVRYFRDLVDRFGAVSYALASYNAGDVRVAEWIKTAPDLAEDEFIDSIPFPETQNYVKRILGTREDYRRLYGTGLLSPNARQAASAAD